MKRAQDTSWARSCVSALPGFEAPGGTEPTCGSALVLNASKRELALHQELNDLMFGSRFRGKAIDVQDVPEGRTTCSKAQPEADVAQPARARGTFTAGRPRPARVEERRAPTRIRRKGTQSV